MHHPTRARILLSALLLAWSLGASAAMYKWIDDQGQVHYSQYPPRDRQVQTIVPPPPPATPAAEAQKKLEETLRGLDETRKAREASEQKATDEAAEAERNRRNCAAAQANLERLTTGGRKKIVGEDGVAYYMTEEERQKRVQEARDQIDKYCK